MEQVIFDKAATQGWADFSGDYNPIHFELEKAKLVGADYLITHGMLVILQASRFVDDFIGDDPSRGEGWILYKSLMSRPVPQGVAVTLTCTNKGNSARITASFGEETCFKANVKCVAAENAHPVQGERITLAAANCAAFFETFPRHRTWWRALNAVVFADFIANRSQVIREIIEARVGYELADPALLIVHISHAISFAASSLAGLPLSASGARAYDMALMDVLEKDGNLLCTILFNVFVDEDFVMTIEMGLMIKVQP